MRIQQHAERAPRSSLSPKLARLSYFKKAFQISLRALDCAETLVRLRERKARLALHDPVASRGGNGQAGLVLGDRRKQVRLLAQRFVCLRGVLTSGSTSIPAIANRGACRALPSS